MIDHVIFTLHTFFSQFVHLRMLRFAGIVYMHKEKEEATDRIHLITHHYIQRQIYTIHWLPFNVICLFIKNFHLSPHVHACLFASIGCLHALHIIQNSFSLCSSISTYTFLYHSISIVFHSSVTKKKFCIQARTHHYQKRSNVDCTFINANTTQHDAWGI